LECWTNICSKILNHIYSEKLSQIFILKKLILIEQFSSSTLLIDGGGVSEASMGGADNGGTTQYSLRIVLFVALVHSGSIQNT
jgi:hypothetical protein